VRLGEGAAADAIRSLATAAPTGGDPAHRYSLDEFGLTSEEVDERFDAHSS